VVEWWWNGEESWSSRQINVLGTTFVKNPKWFGWWKMVKMANFWLRSGGSELTILRAFLGYFLYGSMNDSPLPAFLDVSSSCCMWLHSVQLVIA
jgi:hypothetical protein